jgi:hypothetical protein
MSIRTKWRSENPSSYEVLLYNKIDRLLANHAPFSLRPIHDMIALMNRRRNVMSGLPADSS